MYSSLLIKHSRNLLPAMNESPLYDVNRSRIVELINRHSANVERDWSKFGGSEMSTIVLGKDKFRTLSQLLETKAQKIQGKSTNTSTLHTQWGHIFEPVLTKYLEAHWGTEIFELPPSIPSQHPQVGYSADGGMVFVNNSNGEAACSLLEFKNPFERIPNGKIPDDYLYQVKAGLANKNLAEVFPMCLFVDSVQRMCTLSQLAHSGYFNESFHIESAFSYKFGRRKKVQEKYESELDLGIVGLYAAADSDPSFITEVINIRERLMSAIYGPIKDLSANSTYLIGFVFELTSKDRLLPRRLLTYYPDSLMRHYRNTKQQEYEVYDHIKKFDDFCREGGHTPVCVIPYKTMKVCVVPVLPEPYDFIMAHNEKINAAARALDNLLGKNNKQSEYADVGPIINDLSVIKLVD
jgi:hypothetical protein